MSSNANTPQPSAMELTGLSPAYRDNAHVLLDPLRAAAPRYRADALLFLTTMADARTALADPTLSRDPFKTPEGSLARLMTPPDIISSARPNAMLWLDEPEHRINRGLVQPAFFKRCAGMRAKIETIVEALLDEAEKRGGIDRGGARRAPA